MTEAQKKCEELKKHLQAVNQLSYELEQLGYEFNATLRRFQYRDKEGKERTVRGISARVVKVHQTISLGNLIKLTK